MKLNIKSLSITGALLWGGSLFLVGITNAVWPTYGLSFLKVIESIYPEYHADGSFWNVIVGTLYAAVDGAVAGLLFGWVYNLFAVENNKSEA